MQNLYLGFKFAFSYFSILPVKFKYSDDLSSKTVLGSMLLFFPFVGAVLGSLSVGLFMMLDGLSWYGAIISAVAYMMLYGFLHTEAVIDVADAIFASHSGKDAYTIIKDPTVGAMGVLWAIGLVLLKISGIVFLLIHHLFSEFISIVIISRLALLLLFYTQTFKSIFVNKLKDALRIKCLSVTVIIFSIFGLYLTGIDFIILMFFGFSFSFIVVYFIKSKLGFINGDVLGAILESTEIFLIIAVALLCL
jgi:adenosylcobinamide-GDP ribazoletransferase